MLYPAIKCPGCGERIYPKRAKKLGTKYLLVKCPDEHCGWVKTYELCMGNYRTDCKAPESWMWKNISGGRRILQTVYS